MNLIKTIKDKSVILICLFVFITNLLLCWNYRLDKPTQKHKTILEGNDAKGYYEYLPWILDNKNINYENDYSYSINEKRALKYSYGPALLQSPFYFIDHLVKTKSENETDLTFSNSFFICLGASIYISIALTFLWKLLGCLNVSNYSKLATIISVYLGTNLLHYSIMEPMMSHLYSFLCITIFIYCLISYNQTQIKRYEYGLYISVFLIIAIRQFDFILILPFIIYQAIYFKKIRLLIGTLLVCSISFVIQIILWKLQCGEWLLKPYQNENIFYWTDPQIINVLFGFRKGLFIYSPILFLSIIGLIFGLRTNRQLILNAIVALLIFTYCIACWWHWPFGDSFGHRAFIDCFAILAIGLAYFFESLKNKITKVLFFGISLMLVALNLIQTWQYNNGIILSEYMNFQKYKYQFLYIDDASKNCLGGINDISSFNKNNGTESFLIPNVNFDFNDFSKPFEIKNKLKSKVIFIEINFTKDELSPNQSNQAKLFIEMKGKENTTIYQTAFLINETPNDCETANKKTFSYQIKLPTRENCESVVLFFSNPQRKKFDITNIQVKFDYSK